LSGIGGQDAVDKLLNEKQGHVVKAFYRDDIEIPHIVLVWGYQKHSEPFDGAGMEHIIFRRTSSGVDIEEFLKDLSEVIECGTLKGKNKLGRYEIWHKGKMVILSPEYNGHEIMYVLTAYKQRSIGKPLE